jgi:hypothetical protein
MTIEWPRKQIRLVTAEPNQGESLEETHPNVRHIKHGMKLKLADENGDRAFEHLNGIRLIGILIC